MRARLVLAALSAVVIVAAPLPATAGAAENEATYVVVTAARDADAVVDIVDRVASIDDITEVFDAVGAATAELTSAEARALAADPAVLAIEVDSVVLPAETRSPAMSWGIDRIDQPALPLDNSYSVAPGPNPVTIYVLDSGINASHVEFAGRITATHYTIGTSAQDCTGHGTHVAGTAAGRLAGVMPTATIAAVRVLDCHGGTTSSVVAGLNWVAAHHTTGAAVANLSLSGAASTTLDAALQYLIDDGIVAVVAAGNDKADACTVSPARLTPAITVASTGTTDAFSTFSNHGSCVDLSAPGEAIVAAWIGSTTAGYTSSGTSMAAPHVAGAAAALLSWDPTLSPAGVRDTIMTRSTASVTRTPPGTTKALLHSPMVTAPAVPSAPRSVSAVGHADRVTVAWQPPTPAADSLEYVVSVNGFTSVTTATSLDVEALPGYARVSVLARNPAGSSPAVSTTVYVGKSQGFVAVSPRRVLDSRVGTGGYNVAWAPGDTRSVSLQDAVPAGTRAVVLNVTVTEPTGGGYATLWPSGSAMPLVSSLNWQAGDTAANLVTVPLPEPGGRWDRQVSIYSPAGRAHFIADIVGYYSDDAPGQSAFVSKGPVRVLDSRDGTGTKVGRWADNGETRDLWVGTGSPANLPDSATAVVLNLTQTNAARGGYATAYPSGEPQPLASNLNWATGSTRANLVTVKIGANRRVSLYANGTDLIADVVGYYTSDASSPAAATLRPLPPTRIVDSRTGLGGYSTAWGTGTQRSVQVTGMVGESSNSVSVPTTAKAVVVNVTAANTTAPSWMTVWSSSKPRPYASNLNWNTGQVVPNMAIVEVGTDGRINLYNAGGSVAVIVDIVGFLE
jgi:subtilisin family serine protease